MDKVNLIKKEIINGKTNLKLKQKSVIFYRSFSRVLGDKEIESIIESLKIKTRNKKDKLVDTEYGEIKKSKKQEFLSYIEEVIKPMINKKRKELNV